MRRKPVDPATDSVPFIFCVCSAILFLVGCSSTKAQHSDGAAETGEEQPIGGAGDAGPAGQRDAAGPGGKSDAAGQTGTGGATGSGGQSSGMGGSAGGGGSQGISGKMDAAAADGSDGGDASKAADSGAKDASPVDAVVNADACPLLPPPTHDASGSQPGESCVCQDGAWKCQAPTLVGSCQTISASGSYRISADLPASGGTTACLEVSSVNGVYIDCDGHSVSASEIGYAIELNTVKGFSISNCHIGGLLRVSQSSMGMITNNQFLSTASVVGSYAGSSDKITITENTIFGAGIGFIDFMSGISYSGALVLDSVTNSTVTKNNITTIKRGASSSTGVVIALKGLNNLISENTIDGQATVVAGDVQKSKSYGGADDGIVLYDETGVKIINNHLNNFYDMGVEALGSINGATIGSNTISGASFGAIGGWYSDFSAGNLGFILKTSVISQNVGQNTPNMFIFSQNGTVQYFDDASASVAFPSNTFQNNNLK